MRHSSNALTMLLAGKTPEAMYDALYAGRYLSAQGEDSSPEVLSLLKTVTRSVRQRPLLPATLMDRLTTALANSGFLNEAGIQLASQEVADG
jgi:hypothetical protein